MILLGEEVSKNDGISDTGKSAGNEQLELTIQN